MKKTRYTVRLPKALEKRLAECAERSGKPKAFIVHEAILGYLEDLGDVYAAEQVLERVRAGKERIYTRGELEAKYEWNKLEGVDSKHAGE